MKKVMLIAPYQGMANIVNNLEIPDELDLTVKVANLEEALTFVIEAEKRDYDFIISRGGTASLIEENTNLPVIHIDITGYDILRIFTMIKGIDSKVALVGFPNIADGAATICDILEFNVEVLTIESQDEVEQTLVKLKNKGYSVVIGDVVTVGYAKQVGLHGMLLTSGKEAILDSLKVGNRLYQINRTVNNSLKVYEQTLDSLPLPMLIINNEPKVIFQNKRYKNDFITLEFEKNIEFINKINDLEDNQENIFHDEKNSKNYKLKAFKTNLDITHKGIIVEEIKEKIESNVIEKEIISEKPHIIGISDTSTKIRSLIDRYNDLSNPLYITGEIGSGKKTFAKAIHFQKYGSGVPIHYIDAINLSKHKTPECENYLQQIQTGSIILYNFDEFSFDQQSVILKSFNEKVQVFLIYNKSLIQDVDIQENPTFRAGEILNDAETIHIDPLRKRKEDIKYFIKYYLSDLNATKGLEILGIKNDALEYLKSRYWKGNVTQLKKTIKDVSYSIGGYYIEMKDIKLLPIPNYNKDFNEDELVIEIGRLKDIEKEVIQAVLEKENGNQSKAAKILGINRSTLWRKLND